MSEEVLNNINQYEEAIQAILSLGKGTRINICYKIFEEISSAPQNFQSSLLRFTMENFGVIDSAETINVDVNISNEQKEELTERHEAVVDAMLVSLIQRNLEENEFYDKCWNNIVNNISFFTDKKEQVYALYNILIDARIPYFKLQEEGLKMTNEDFKKLFRKMGREVAKLRFILSRDFSQKTEKASHIVNTLNGHNMAEKSILITYLLYHFEQREDYIKQAFKES